ncbi:hypothetical protein FF011L_10070 [Roseimaritima multifibrata]|uniref:Uncharacterized protein n=1 Tax=Roseimaritima multifibrata TaxID=1930274 RepID=A0A517MBM7_9BACT|nr:hypothetical protein [Roseimaritima multifibrata]QDS92265.1 hypothetical protein FF011L_10070 [Roseimaritima multifibrata]
MKRSQPLGLAAKTSDFLSETARTVRPSHRKQNALAVGLRPVDFIESERRQPLSHQAACAGPLGILAADVKADGVGLAPLVPGAGKVDELRGRLRIAGQS